jgi:hypothetical protein
LVQQTELNKGRTEARAVARFAVSAAQVCFPQACQAALLQQAIDDPSKPHASFKQFFLLTSQEDLHAYDAPALLDDKRGYWGIENRLHQPLDVIALEDKSRVRTLNCAWNLAMFRRLSLSFAIHWCRHQRNPRQATLSGFYDAMKADRARRAFNLLTAAHPAWLPDG